MINKSKLSLSLDEFIDKFSNFCSIFAKNKGFVCARNFIDY